MATVALFAERLQVTDVVLHLKKKRVMESNMHSTKGISAFQYSIEIEKNKNCMCPVYPLL